MWVGLQKETVPKRTLGRPTCLPEDRAGKLTTSQDADCVSEVHRFCLRMKEIPA